MNRIVLAVCVLVLTGCSATNPSGTSAPAPRAATDDPGRASGPELGNFSVSLAVKDIAASRAFYEKLGFRVIAGNQGRNWLILQNDTATIGLFQGMFEKNGLTFNPGWDRSSQPLGSFDDVRDIQRTFRERGLTLTLTADDASAGPASIALMDPDGNPILIDQHVPRAGAAGVRAATTPRPAAGDGPCVMRSRGLDVLRVTPPGGAKCTPGEGRLHFGSRDGSVDVWLAPGARTVDDAKPRVAQIISPEFEGFKPTETAQASVAGSAAVRVLGSGVEADDSDPGTADVVIFSVAGHVFIACTHGEALSSSARQMLVTVVQSAQAP